MLRLIFNSIFSAFIKYECVACDIEHSRANPLCGDCQRQIGAIDQSTVCKKCGRYCLADVCYFCITSPPLFTKAYAYCVYDDISSTTIKNFKYHNNTRCMNFIAHKMAMLAFDCIQYNTIDYITCVPMNGLKEYIKGYNHSGKIAKVIAKEINTVFLPSLLKRKLSFKRQAVSSRSERFKNIDGSFKVVQKGKMKGKAVLLIDDTITTGATANECAKVLFEAGASAVIVLTFAKSIKDEENLRLTNNR